MNGAGRYFDDHQRRTVEAAMARIIPADHQPGAREAGTVEFIDRYLSGIDFVYAKPDGSGFERLEGKLAEAWRQLSHAGLAARIGAGSVLPIVDDGDPADGLLALAERALREEEAAHGTALLTPRLVAAGPAEALQAS